jgi:8-oxo-dGTP pyrophosphatase MutT (NUDIX family)
VQSRSSTSQSENWETLSRRVHFEDPHVSVASESVRSPANPEPHSWTVVNRKPAVVVAAMTAEGKLVMVRQERIAIRRALWEVPAGQIDDPAEDESGKAEAVALRELREETGYQLSDSGEIVPLGDFFSSPGFTDERAWLFLVRPVEPAAAGAAHSETESILDCRAFTPTEIGEMIASNEIRDANTLAIVARLVARGLLSLGT